MSKRRINHNAMDLVRYAESHGFKTIRQKRHIVMRRDDGTTVTISVSPSDYQGLENKRSEIRRLAKGQK